MLCLAIHIYEDGKSQPSPSIRIPLAVVRTMAKLIPASLTQTLRERGVALDQLITEASSKTESGVLLDIQDDGDRIVVAIEPMTDQPSRNLPARSGE